MTFLEDGFEEFLKTMSPGRPVMQILRYRQGGDARSWGQAGGTSYAPRNAFVQAGSRAWSGAAATTGVLSFAYPVAFADTPLVWVQVVITTPGNEPVQVHAQGDLPGLAIRWWTGNPVTLIWFHWLAIGPGAV